MNQKTHTYSASLDLSLTPLLFISGLVLCILKGAGHLHWDWWVVLIPLYPFILVIGLVMLSFVLALATVGLVWIGMVLGNKPRR